MAHILVVEDERNVALRLKSELSTEGHTVEIVGDGEAAVDRAMRSDFDLILLNIGLPKKDGNAVCRELRHVGNRTPIVMLTARQTETDKVLGLDLGADDYVVKPWLTLELLARVRAVLRRATRDEFETYRFGDVKVDITKVEVLVNNKPIHLTRLEFRLLRIFVRRPGRVHSQEALYAEVGSNSPEAVKDHVMYLRRKIEPDPRRPRYVVTVPGMGYRFEGSLITRPKPD